MEHVDVEGLRIAYRREGAGSPLVLLHGAVCDGRVWRVELDGFAADFDALRRYAR
jgi:pimeloyl-ACP methyl ester carboxylesterase